MRHRDMLRWLVVAGIIAVTILAPAAAFAQSDAKDEGVLLRVNGDAVLPTGDAAGAAIVVRGDLLVEGTVRTVVIVDGTVTLRGADVETLVVVSGAASLEEGSTVSGDVFLTDSTLNNDGTAEVSGSIREDFQGFLVGFWIIGVILAIGLGILAILGALAFAGVAPTTARNAGAAIRTDFGRVMLAGVVLWIAVPLVAGLLLLTIVGIPTTFAVWFGVLPIMGFIGYLVTGIWIGGLIVAREGGEGHPYLAAFLGTLILVAVAFVPVLGPLVGTLAALLGSSALALLAWRNVFGARSEGEGAEPAPG